MPSLAYREIKTINAFKWRRWKGEFSENSYRPTQQNKSLSLCRFAYGRMALYKVEDDDDDDGDDDDN